MKVYKILADLDFASKLFENQAQTSTGDNLLKNYQAYVMSNPVSCALVNKFLNEAKNVIYDNGVAQVCENVTKVINDNKYSWAIASVCEDLINRPSKSNYLIEKAIEQVEPMLEMEEKDIVSYIKGGAMKSVMFVEQFRNIAKSIFRNQPVVEKYNDFTIVHPYSVVEKNNEQVYFEVLGNIYKINEDKIELASAQEVSKDFIYMSRLIESRQLTMKDETLYMTIGKREYSVKETDKCEVKAQDKVYEFNTQQLRENSAAFLSMVQPNMKVAIAEQLESFAKIVENFSNICILNNVNLISSRNDQLMVIENKGNAYVQVLASNHNTRWNLNDNIANVCKSIKENTHIDLTENYKDSITKVVEQVTEEEGKAIKEQLEKDEIEQRRQTIIQLTEKYKSDNVRLAMLAKIAADLNKVETL